MDSKQANSQDMGCIENTTCINQEEEIILCTSSLGLTEKHRLFTKTSSTIEAKYATTKLHKVY
jgi:hypothetical protein